MKVLEPRIQLLDLKRQYRPLRTELLAVTEEVLDSGWYLLGDRTRDFESAFSSWVGQAQGVACANGTDAITLALLALELEPGAEVLTVSNTAFASACGISRAGARPVLVDIDPGSWLIDPEQVAQQVGPRTRAVLAVHLYGQVVDLDALHQVLPEGVEIIEDCAQAHGAEYRGRRVGSHQRLSCFSFYPSKNLGALGDAGMVLSDDDSLAEKMRALRFYGQTSRDQHASVGMNSRMDEMQAAILKVQLAHLEDWANRRREIAARYDAELDPQVFRRPRSIADARAAYHLYVLRVKDRDAFRQFLDQRGIDTGIHYPNPIHQQPAYAEESVRSGPLPETELLCQEIVSLPVAPHLEDHEVERVVAACRQYTETLP